MTNPSFSTKYHINFFNSPSFKIFGQDSSFLSNFQEIGSNFYSDTTSIVETRNNSRITYTSGSYHLNHLFFILINNSGTGGALSFSGNAGQFCRCNIFTNLKSHFVFH
jgi:hypothetical protein